jgi:hypothetical protein
MLVKPSASLAPAGEVLPALVPWRDPHTVPASQLKATVEELELACVADPGSADLRTCLGMAYAMSHDVRKSMDALEDAIALAPDNFWARLKYAELHYRLRILNRAEAETIAALNLARNGWQLSLARKQLQDIRALKVSAVRNVDWTKPLAAPAILLSLMLAAVFVVMMWK